VSTRGVKLPTNYAVLPTLDADIIPKHASRADMIAAGKEKTGLASHVLLAGCGAKQESKEEDSRGRFSKALLDVLRSDGTDKLTYEKLIERLPLLPE
jgi:nitrogenase subunit NifH